MSNIKKIRQEIERRHDYENEMYHKTKPDGRPNDGWAESLAIMGVLEELLSFIDSLPEEKPSEDLEKAAVRYERENRQSVLSSVDIVNAFIAGAEWQKMKKATVKAEAEVCKLTDRVWITPTDEKRFHQDVYDNFKAGDNVEIIIVKEDDGQLHQTEKE